MFSIIALIVEFIEANFAVSITSFILFIIAAITGFSLLQSGNINNGNYGNYLCPPGYVKEKGECKEKKDKEEAKSEKSELKSEKKEEKSEAKESKKNR